MIFMHSQSQGDGANQSTAFPNGLLPPMVTYAQNFEDVMLRRALGDIERGFYVDIGAHDATNDSVTRWFYDSGWRGIDVEPNPLLWRQLVEGRPGDIVLDCAVAAKSGSILLTVFGETGLATTDSAAAQAALGHGIVKTAEVHVAAMTLDELLDQHAGGKTIDFLKIDVEGAEHDIIISTSFEIHRPRVIVVEATLPLSTEPTWDSWEPHILGRGYSFAWFDGLNRFYVREEDSHRLSAFAVPPCVFDHFVSYSFKQAQDRLEEVANDYQKARKWGEDCQARLNEVAGDYQKAREWGEDFQRRLEEVAHDYQYARKSAEDCQARLTEVADDYQKARKWGEDNQLRLAEMSKRYEHSRNWAEEYSRRLVVAQARISELETLLSGSAAQRDRAIALAEGLHVELETLRAGASSPP